jgi:hypothetical protein
MKPVFVGVAASLLAATPATAVTYDLYNSFNGSASANNFNFFEFNALNAPRAITALSTCSTGIQCLLSATGQDGLGFYKNISGVPKTLYSTINAPANSLHFHPGPTFDAGVVFVAPTTGYYRVSEAFSLITNQTPTGVLISNYKFSINGLMTKLSDIVLTAAKRSDSAKNTIFLNAGEGVGTAVNDGGTEPTSYFYDSTSISYQVEAIPEPASWVLLIAGFGLTGAVLRRRRAMPAAA